jgi:DNA glycosylase AlkZ-like
MVERLLTERELNRALLARQLLLERSEIPLPRAVERVGGLQSQYSPSAYVALWSRLDGFERNDLTRALERKAVVQGTLMRATIHMVSRRDYPLIAAGIRRARREWWLRLERTASHRRTMEALAERLRSMLADGPRRRSEIVEDLGLDASTWNGLGLWVDLVRVPPSGTWDRRRADLYGLAESWLGADDASEEDGLELLVRRYLAAFGPATRADVASWAGVPVATLAPAIERVRPRWFRDERGVELLDLPRAPLPDPGTPAPPRFLPTWDATLLVHARRTQIVPERHRPRVFNTATPHSAATFLVDGQVAGTWRYETGRVQVEAFETLPRQVRRRLADEAERLAAFHA